MSPAAADRPAPRAVGRWALALVLLVAGLGHLANPEVFLAQVPPWFPARDAVVLGSGLVEIALAVGLVAARRRRALVGWVVAAFFAAVFPGNVSQFLTHTDAFGLDSDGARAARLLGQPVLVVWALWSTGAWRDWRARSDRARRAGG